MEAIKDFICNLPGDFPNRRNYKSVISLYSSQPVKNSKSSVYIGITNTDFIKNELISFFDSLV